MKHGITESKNKKKFTDFMCQQIALSESCTDSCLLQLSVGLLIPLRVIINNSHLCQICASKSKYLLYVYQPFLFLLLWIIFSFPVSIFLWEKWNVMRMLWECYCFPYGFRKFIFSYNTKLLKAWFLNFSKYFVLFLPFYLVYVWFVYSNHFNS